MTDTAWSETVSSQPTLNEAYFNLMWQIKYSDGYYWFYLQRCKRWNTFADVVCVLITLACSVSIALIGKGIITSRFAFLENPATYTILVFICQLILALKGRLPLMKQISGLEKLEPEMNSLFADMENSWLDLGFQDKQFARKKLKNIGCDSLGYKTNT